MANLQRDPKRYRKPFEPGDFFPGLKRHVGPKKKQTWQDMKAMCKLMNAMYQGDTVNSERPANVDTSTESTASED
jgi:hypothetical protein